jgi:hypothetical protein
VALNEKKRKMIINVAQVDKDSDGDGRGLFKSTIPALA